MSCQGRPHIHLGERVIDIINRIDPDQGEPIGDLETILLRLALARADQTTTVERGSA